MNLSLYQLYLIKEKMEQENLIGDSKYQSLCEKINTEEVQRVKGKGEISLALHQQTILKD